MYCSSALKKKHKPQPPLLRQSVIALALISISQSPMAEDRLEFKSQTVYGATGLLTIPTADVMDYGNVSMSYNNFLNPEYQSLDNREAQNFLFGVGVFPGLELFGRLAEVHEKGYQTHTYGNFDSRDLIGNVKYKLPLPSSWPSFAVGIQDAAGLAVKERRYYATSTFHSRFVDATLGYAQKALDSRHDEMLDGVFAGLDVKVSSFAKIQAEHDGLEQRAGVAFNWDQPFGWDMNLMASSVLYSSLEDEDPSFSIGLNIPLGRASSSKNDSPDYKAEQASQTEYISDNSSQKTAYIAQMSGAEVSSVERQNAEKTVLNRLESEFALFPGNEVINSEIYTEQGNVDEQLMSWAEGFKAKLIEAGFEHLTFSYDPNASTLYLSYQNRAYAHGEFAALKALMTELKNQSGIERFKHIEILTVKEGQPLMALSVEVDWLLENEKGISKSPTSTQFRVQFANQFHHKGRILASSGKQEWLDIEVSPAFKAFYGHEYDIWDYSLALRTNFKVPLWQGANASLVHEMPVAHSYNFNDGEVFDDSRHESRWSELMLHQTIQPLPSLLNTTSVGRLHVYDRPYNALINTTRWYGWGGQHQFYAQFGKLYGELYGPNDYRLADREIEVLGYEYLWSSLNLALNYEYGQYYEQDLSSKVTLKSFLGDTTVNLQYVQSDLGWSKVGVGISFPFWGQKKIELGPVSISGDQNWTHQIVTTVDDPSGEGRNLTSANANYVNVGLNPWISQTLHQEGMQHGRFTPDYIQKHVDYLLN
ncbi:YjbH domain-containing protein [Thiomicrorhabdus chilensis]|uniref:YjbH domain-containing protein n=1 Tax=Thiomicrorhabdus chilensis TaxID=63656 RepID=UPI00040FAD5C|nr:YjbH domain-containing protein [Thiomicrorhabdus chilensis]